MNNIKKIVLGVCGSIAAYKAGDLIRRLQDQGCDVSVIMTKAAQKFISPTTLSALSGKQVYIDMFDEATAWQMPHISLAQTADVILIAPATASVIAHLAHGFADDLLTCTAISTKAPIFIAPAMNDEMYANQFVQENCNKLKQAGITFVEPIAGKLACGSNGVGHLADIDDIVNVVIKS